MRILLWFLGLFALAAGVAVALRYNESYALLVMPPWRVQISLNLLIALLIGLFIALYALIRIILHAIRLPATVQAWRKRQARRTAAQALQDACRLYLEGRYGQAYRHAEAAFQDDFPPGLAALLAAKSAHAMREPVRRQQWLDRALEFDRETRLARLMVEAEHAVSDRRFDLATNLLEALRLSGRRHIATLRLSLQTEQGRGRWEEVARLARQLRKHKGLTAEQAAPLVRRALLEQLREAAGEPQSLQRLWQSIPAEERNEAAFLVRAVPYYVEAGLTQLAANAIEESLSREWDSELALLYGRCESDDMRAQLATAEAWLKRHPHDAGLLLTLGRLCVRAQLWGKAESYMEASLSITPARDTHLELARLADSLGRTELAAKHFRAAAEWPLG